MKKYEWRPGHGCKISAQVVGERIEAIRRKAGDVVSPEQVLKDARSKNSPLHTFFEWDDTVAAEAHRINQARSLLRSYTYTIIAKENKDPRPIIANVSIGRSVKGQGAYVSTELISSNAGVRNRVLADALGQLIAWKKRYGHLKELAAIVSLIDKQAEELLTAKV